MRKVANKPIFVKIGVLSVVAIAVGAYLLPQDKTSAIPPTNRTTAQQPVAVSKAQPESVPPVPPAPATHQAPNTLAQNGSDDSIDHERPWLEASIQQHPDSDYWRQQAKAHLAQPRTAGWVKFESYQLSKGQDPLKLPTFSQMVDSEHTESQLIVRLKIGTNATKALESLGLNHIASLTNNNANLPIHSYSFPANQMSMSEALERVNSHPAVLYAEPDYNAELTVAPNETNAGINTQSAWWLNQINAYAAWDISTDARAIGPVAVIDSGIENHEDLQGNFWPGTNLSARNTHGTAVAGTICARGNNGIGYVGTAWRCQLMNSVYSPGSNASAAAASFISSLVYSVDAGSRISNNSFGIFFYSQAYKDTVEYAASHDHLMVASAGNSYMDADSYPVYPSGFDNPNIVSVAGSYLHDTRASFSNWGATSVDIAAPTGFYTTRASIGGYGGSGKYLRFNGTSQAGPVVTGAVALAWSLDTAATYADIKRRLIATARQSPVWQGTNVSGGILDLEALLLSMDNDQDGIIDSQDSDDDNDGVADVNDDFPLDSSANKDSDGDGVADSEDAFPNNASESADSDGDGAGDNRDRDADNDGIADTLEASSTLMKRWKNGRNAQSNANSIRYINEGLGGSGGINSAYLSDYGFSTSYRITFKLGNNVSGNFAVGLGLAESGANLNDINHAFYISNGRLSASENGSTVANLGSATANSTLGFDVVEGQIRYLVGGNVAFTRQMSPIYNANIHFNYGITPDFYIDSWFQSAGQSVHGFKITPLGGYKASYTVYSTVNATMTARKMSVDTDGDGVHNAADQDSDNDTIPDVIEAGLNDGNGDLMIDSASQQASVNPAPDSDHDGIPDYLDLESNNAANDGTAYDIDHTAFSAEDTNNDGQLNSLDTNGGNDFNNNGVDDLIEGNVGNSNTAPVLQNPGSQSNTQSDSVTLVLTASDADGDTLSFSATGLPAGLSINASNGRISGTVSTIGTSNVTVSVSDGKQTASVSFQWSISQPDNTAPVLQNPGSQSNTQSDSVTLALTASDADGDTLSFSATGLPAGLSINASNGRISGTVSTIGSSNVTVSVSDGKQTASVSFQWSISQPDNTAPVLQNPGSQSNTQSDTVTLALTASDADGDTLSFSATGLPAGLSINASNGRISGTVSTVGSSNVTVSVSDGKQTVSVSFQWSISQPENTAPVLQNPGSQSNTQSDTVTLVLTASDADGDTLSFSATGLPAGLSINASNGRISGTVSALATSNVTVSVSDGKQTVSVSFQWIVSLTDIRLNSGVAKNNSVAEGAWKYYIYSASADIDRVVFYLEGLSDDADIYVRRGARPIGEVTGGGTYDGSSTRGGNASELIELPNTGATDWYIAVHGYKATAFRVTANGIDDDTGGTGGDDDSVALSNGQSVSASVDTGAWRYYTLQSAASHTQLQVDLSGLQADADLYVRAGARPSGHIGEGGIYDCDSTLGSSRSERCVLPNTAATTWHIAVHGYQGSSFALVANLTPVDGGGEGGGDDERSLSLGQAAQASITAGEWHHYALTVPAENNSLQVELSGLSDDVDLYVRRGARPTGNVDENGSYDCGSFAGGDSSEACILPVASQGRYYISVYGYRASAYSLLARGSGEVLSVQSLSSGTAVSGQVATGQWKYYKLDTDVPNNRLDVSLNGLSTDIDLYVRQGQIPAGDTLSGANSDCFSLNGQANPESCQVPLTGQQSWYVGVYGYVGGPFTLTATANRADNRQAQKNLRPVKAANYKAQQASESVVSAAGSSDGLLLLLLGGLVLRRRKSVIG